MHIFLVYIYMYIYIYISIYIYIVLMLLVLNILLVLYVQNTCHEQVNMYLKKKKKSFLKLNLQ